MSLESTFYSSPIRAKMTRKWSFSSVFSLVTIKINFLLEGFATKTAGQSKLPVRVHSLAIRAMNGGHQRGV